MSVEVHNITWRGIDIEIVHVPAKFGLVDHIQLFTHPRTPLPVTETGYISQHLPIGTVEERGGALAFVTAWLDHEAERIGWSGAQLTLI